ncbi:uncharacterized protein LOC119745212 [Patiria miniata]|uniref:F-box domain-containing protein n=1 Tax=Patiria miniata TaxID=46514 RepID=A0A914BM51_PATMI|nr:uncharacterized protein LOC119745212 [Patiria miniata]
MSRWTLASFKMTSVQGAGDKQREEADVVCHSEASQNPVDCLPNEILWKIIGFLSLEDLCYLAVCSKTWRNVTNTNSLWLHLCKLRDWERFGTEVDLRKETPIHSTGTSTSGTSPTFQTDSVINDDCNLKDLAPTCEWKEVYMRAWHLDRNWSEGRYQEHSLVLSDSGSDFNNATTRCVASDGTIFGAGDTTEYVGLWELKFSGQFLQKIQPSKYIPLPRTSYNEIEAMTMKDNIGVAAFMGGILVFEASTGNVLKLIRGTASDFDRYKPSGLYMEEDKVIVSYRHYQRADNDEGIPVHIWDISGLVELRDWERFGTEVDLRKEKPIHSITNKHGKCCTTSTRTGPTFQADSVITVDCNLKELHQPVNGRRCT